MDKLDMISPCTLSFVLITLEDILNTSIVLKSVIGIKAAKNDLIIHYLMFADDCLIFYKQRRRRLGM